MTCGSSVAIDAGGRVAMYDLNFRADDDEDDPALPMDKYVLPNAQGNGTLNQDYFLDDQELVDYCGSGRMPCPSRLYTLIAQL